MSATCFGAQSVAIYIETTVVEQAGQLVDNEPHGWIFADRDAFREGGTHRLLQLMGDAHRVGGKLDFQCNSEAIHAVGPFRAMVCT